MRRNVLWQRSDFQELGKVHSQAASGPSVFLYGCSYRGPFLAASPLWCRDLLAGGARVSSRGSDFRVCRKYLRGETPPAGVILGKRGGRGERAFIGCSDRSYLYLFVLAVLSTFLFSPRVRLASAALDRPITFLCPAGSAFHPASFASLANLLLSFSSAQRVQGLQVQVRPVATVDPLLLADLL